MVNITKEGVEQSNRKTYVDLEREAIKMKRSTLHKNKFYLTVRKIVKTTPNDAEQGAAIRKLIN